MELDIVVSCAKVKVMLVSCICEEVSSPPECHHDSGPCWCVTAQAWPPASLSDQSEASNPGHVISSDQSGAAEAPEAMSTRGQQCTIANLEGPGGYSI